MPNFSLIINWRLVYSSSQESEVCPMPYALCPIPYALCPIPYARRVPHVTEKGDRSLPYGHNCYSIFIKIYDLLQLQFKTHSVQLRLVARRAGPLDSFGNCAQRRLVRHPHRIGLPLLGLPLPNTIYTPNPSARGNCGGWRGTELISHSGTADRQPREPVGATRNKPAVGPGTGLQRRVHDRTSSSFASIHARSRLVSPLSIFSSAFLMSFISLTVAKPLYKH